MTDQKPTGVFVRLPLSEDQIDALYNPKRSGEENLLSIGTPVQVMELYVVGYEYEMALRIEGGEGVEWEEAMPRRFIPPYEDGWRVRNVVPLVRQSDAQAQIAARDAEIVRLREALDRIRLIPFPMMDLPAGIMHGIAHKALKGGAA